MMTHILWKIEGSDEYKQFYNVLSVLSYMLKAPLTPPATPVVNALTKQRACLANIFRACLGLQPEADILLEHKLMWREPQSQYFGSVDAKILLGGLPF